MTTEQKQVIEESDKDTIKKVYEKYIEEYKQKPHSPDIFTRFAKNYQDVHISFASAKSFLNDMKHSSSKTTTSSFLAPNLQSIRSSVSTPNVLTQSNIQKKKKLKTHLNEKYENINDLHLLKQIKNIIMNLDCIKNNKTIKSKLNNIIFKNKDSQYFELMKRLSSSKLNDIGIGKLYMQPSISKDETFLSLKHYTERDDVSDVDHDAAMYLLKNYYDTGPSNITYETTDDNDDNISIYDRMVLKYRRLSHSESVYTINSGDKRLSLSLNENIKPNFGISNEPPLMDKGFRALSTDVSLSADVSIVTDVSDTENDDNKNKINIPPSFMNIMSKYDSEMDNWDFDIFSFMDDPVFCGKGLVYLSFYLFRKVGLLDSTGVSQKHLWRFFEQVDNGYINTNPYHNKYHAVDILLNTHFVFQESEFMKSHMTQWDKFGAYIAAVCHDLGHMGFNNNWYINTAGNLALLYGNESVLENYHLNETFRLLNKPSSNWMVSFTSSIRKYLSIVIKHSILATDVKHHGIKVHQLQNMINEFKKENKNFNLIKLQKCQSIVNYASIESIKKDGFKLFINNNNIENTFEGDIIINDINMNEKEKDNDIDQKEDDNILEIIQPRIEGVSDERLFILGVTIHACDVANPCKPLIYALKWAHNYIDEVFNQGDTERSFGIPVSFGMDRNNTKLPTSQIGFITYIVKKLFILYDELINSNGTKQCLKLLDENEKFWIQEKKESSVAYKIAKKPGLGTIDETIKIKTVKFSDHAST